MVTPPTVQVVEIGKVVDVLDGKWIKQFCTFMCLSMQVYGVWSRGAQETGRNLG